MSGGYSLERARRMLALPDGWLEASGDGYILRTGPDRRARVMMRLDEAAFRALVDAPGLSPRKGGGWQARRATGGEAAAPAPGRPGVTEGLRTVMQADAAPVERQANLTLSAIDWLAKRADADGRPWLSAIERAAAEQLMLEAETAAAGPSLTQRWDALPRSGSGGVGPGRPPGDRAVSAARRLEKALAACGPARVMVEHVCLRATALQAAEQSLGLRRRTGKALLKQGLAALARHYRLG